MFLDSLDGRVARLTNSQSTFGEQYDSLADMISFGAAPAWSSIPGRSPAWANWGWLAAFIYVQPLEVALVDDLDVGVETSQSQGGAAT